MHLLTSPQATIAAVALYVVGVMPSKSTEAQAAPVDKEHTHMRMKKHAARKGKHTHTQLLYLNNFCT